MNTKLIMISLDAVGSEDFSALCEMPNMRRFLDGACSCGYVKSVYPSYTYPAHASLATGMYPSHHGVIHNEKMQPEKTVMDWYEESATIKTPTLYDEAAGHGITTATLLWPCAAGNKAHYNLPEVKIKPPYPDLLSASIANGSKDYVLDLERRFGDMRSYFDEPQLDDFLTESFLYTLRQYRPELTMLHMIDVDTQKHFFGAGSPEAQAALIRQDRRLGRILDFMESDEEYRQADLLLFGDHSQGNVGYSIYLNALFAKLGYLTPGEGTVTGWDVYCFDISGSAYIYIRPEKREALYTPVLQLLEKLKSNPENGIEHIFSAEEAARLGADPNCDFMLEAMDGFCFSRDTSEEVVRGICADRPISREGCVYKSVHGYLPDKKSAATFFAARGRHIVPGVQIRGMGIVDIAPTAARILGFEMKGADGRVLTEIIDS